MIKITNLTKKFDNEIIFNKFSYTFNKTGFYVLFGDSGCGKSTLLNLISGLLMFDNGKITISNKTYENQVNWDEIKSNIGYMTQDPHWIDYLTVGEQLELLGHNKENILKILEEFELKQLYNSYFSEISGGQKQRIYLTQFLLQSKNIILLDEPTASLDFESKKSVFKMLNSIKNKTLIICASHDTEILKYCDKVLNLSQMEELEKSELNNFDVNINCTDYNVDYIKHKQLYPYFKKWFNCTKREKKSIIIMAFIYVLVYLSVFIADVPTSKENVSMQQLYRINQCYITIDGLKRLDDLVNIERSKIKEAVLVYNGSCPDNNFDNIAIETLYNTIPFDQNAFKYTDKILYGSYFTERNQVILSYKKALEYGNPVELINESINLEMYDGMQNFKIVGIFDEFTDSESQYLRQSLAFEDNGIFLNGKYTNTFDHDKKFNWNNKKTYVLYFDSYKDMKEFVNTNKKNTNLYIDDKNIDYKITSVFEMMFYILFPASFIVVLFANLFYYQIKRIEIMYNSHLISLYEYLGFEKKEIKKCWIIGNMSENIKVVICSFFISFIISSVINNINIKYNFLPFALFTYNYQIILGYFILNFLISTAISAGNFKFISNIKWYDMFLQKRDLL